MKKLLMLMITALLVPVLCSAVTVKKLSGKTLAIDVDVRDTVGKVKQKIADKEGIPVEQVVLRYQGKVLIKDSSRLTYYNVQEDSTLYVSFVD